MVSTSESWLAFVRIHTTGWATSWQGAAPTWQGQHSGCHSLNGTLELSLKTRKDSGRQKRTAWSVWGLPTKPPLWAVAPVVRPCRPVQHCHLWPWGSSSSGLCTSMATTTRGSLPPGHSWRASALRPQGGLITRVGTTRILSSALAALINLFHMIDRFHPQGPAGAQMEKQHYFPNCLISRPSLDSPPSEAVMKATNQVKKAACHARAWAGKNYVKKIKFSNGKGQVMRARSWTDGSLPVWLLQGQLLCFCFLWCIFNISFLSDTNHWFLLGSSAPVRF